LLPEGMKEALKSKQRSEEKDYPMFYPIVGYRYRSEAIIADDASSTEQEIALLDREELTGQPGSRVPHLWLERDGQRLSTLDLLDGSFVLLAGPDGTPWQKAATEVASTLGIKLLACRVGPDGDLLDVENDWQAKMGVSPEGVVLVRPDGFVAWRSSTVSGTPALLLEQVLSRILARSASFSREKQQDQ